MVGVSGIGSGMDIQGIVNALVNAEKAPKEAQLARMEKASTTKFSALGQLKSALSEFQASMKNLNSLTLFEKRTATSSNAAALTATASTGAMSGSYQLTVERLASSSKVATASLASSYTASADGVLTVKLGAADAGVEVAIAAGDTLEQVRDKLNASLKDKGITANIVNNPDDGTSRLVLSAKETGAGKDIVISADAALTDLAVDSSVMAGASTAGYLGEPAANAQFTIDGLARTSASNSIAGVIPDVTFTLVGKTEVDKPLTLTVGQDRSGFADNIKKFVGAYNKLITTTSNLTSVTRVGEDKAPVVGGLVGDASVRHLLSGVRNELANPANQESMRVLSDLGITTEKDGTLKIDDVKFDAAIKDDFDALAGLFTGDNGLMSRVDKRIDGFIQTGGVIDQRMKGLETTLGNISKQKENLTRRVDQIRTRLFAQFNAMDSMVAQLSQTSARLMQSLSNLPGVVQS